jgi:cell division protein FtsW (lipid II flippase)
VAEAVTAAVILGGAALLVRRASRTGTGSDAFPSLRRALIDLVTVVAVLLAVVHQPGDVLAAVPAGFAVAVAASATLRRQGVAILLPAAAAAAAVALAVPHLHLYALDRVLTSEIGRTATGLLDAVAVTTAGLLATIALTILVRNDGRARSDAVA